MNRIRNNIIGKYKEMIAWEKGYLHPCTSFPPNGFVMVKVIFLT